MAEQWRSLKDEKPAHGQQCLVWIQGILRGWVEFATWDNWIFFQIVEKNHIELPHVKWWQPLPEPPKMEDARCKVMY